MVPNLMRCRKCGTSNSTSRLTCLHCGRKLEGLITWVYTSKGSDPDATKVDDHAKIHLKQTWKRLTLFVRVFTVAVIMSVGGWLAGYLISPNHLTAGDYTESRRWANSVLSRNADHQALADDFYRHTLESRMWETRREFQSTVAGFFWSSFFLLWLSYSIRNNPMGFDSKLLALPKFFVHRVPFLIAQWKVCVTNDEGNELHVAFHRTG